MVKILICGRSGSGKSFLANHLKQYFEFAHFNGDAVRELTCNKDFTMHGRIKQALMMHQLAENSNSCIAVCDFICPTKELRSIFAPDIIVYCTHNGSRKYQDTDSLFQPVQASEAANVFLFERGNEDELVSKLSEAISQLNHIDNTLT